jgi:8-oxo-dGTP diphosphatase
MSLYVVRHAKAGRRSEWTGNDAARPLSKSGWRQAAGIADRLGGEPLSSLHSSPYVRCLQTLQPLAERCAMTVESDDRLAEDAGFEPALALLGEVGDGAVVCSHGDVIPALIDALRRRGIKVTTAPDWRKATIWVLERDLDGTFTTARAEPPPSEG